MITFHITGLDEIRKRFKGSRAKFSDSLEEAMGNALEAIGDEVPPYPSKPPNSTYIRTGNLGKSMGITMSGGRSGYPDIYTNKMQGRWRVGEYGSRLHYAPYVIGENQAWMHQGRWWNIIDVAQKALPKVEKVFSDMAEKLAKWLENA